MVLLRFAPSPTGPLHLGGLRTALFNHLLAKKLGGKWILRIEDTDATRLVPGSVGNIRKSLEWAGLHYDYGPGSGGPHGPYVQSERLDLYQSYARKLLDSGHAYRCFCSPERLTRVKNILQASKSLATYDRICLKLADEDIHRRLRVGDKHIIRFNAAGLNTSAPPPNDLIFGNLKPNTASLPTDPVLIKSDSFPTYHLASVVDDHEMGITHVLRGEEWLPSLPLHLGLYSSLSVKPPLFGHLPLLLNPDGSKMSKRNGDVAVTDYISKHWEPDAVLNWLAVSGRRIQHVGDNPAVSDVLTRVELEDTFDLSSLTHRRTILDPGKLSFLNRNHLLRQTQTESGLSDVAQRALPIVANSFPKNEYTRIDYIVRVLRALGDRLTTLGSLPTSVPYFFVEPDIDRSEVTTDAYFRTIESALQLALALPSTFTAEEAKFHLGKWQTELSANTKGLTGPLRHALTGSKLGPSMHETMAVLGKDRIIRRLHAALQLKLQ